MSDTQFNLLLAAIGAGFTGLVAIIKWSVGRITKAMDGTSSAMIDNTKSNVALSTKIDIIASFIHRTPPHGVPIRRERSAHDTDEP